MRILYIDTSSSFLYTGVVENEKILTDIKFDFGTDLSKVTMSEIDKMFKKENLNPTDIDKIIVVNGPGSFTGIRIGITIAKVYAWSLNIPITTITSIEAMMISANTDKYIVPIIDARRGYVYSGIYNSNKEEILKPTYLKLTELEEKLKKFDDFVYITNNEIELNNYKISYMPDIEKIVNYYENKENINPHMINPEYLKLTEAEEKNDKKNK